MLPSCAVIHFLHPISEIVIMNLLGSSALMSERIRVTKHGRFILASFLGQSYNPNSRKVGNHESQLKYFQLSWPVKTL